MKKTIVALMLAAATSCAFAAPVSTDTSANANTTTTTSTASSTPFTSIQTSPGAYVGANTLFMQINELNIGYMFNSYFGVEVGHTMYQFSAVALDYVAVKADYHIASSRWSVFAKLGAGELIDSPAAVASLGVGYDFGKHNTVLLGVTGLGQSYKTDDLKTHYAGIYYPYAGYSYHF